MARDKGKSKVVVTDSSEEEMEAPLMCPPRVSESDALEASGSRVAEGVPSQQDDRTYSGQWANSSDRLVVVPVSIRRFHP